MSDVTLAEARELAHEKRKIVKAGLDPIQERDKEKTARAIEAAKTITFGQCARDYIAEHESTWKNEKHAAQWRTTFEGKNAATADINNLPVAAIDTALVLNVLRPIWRKTPETASRIRGRIERVLAWATVSEYRKGENPARWRGHLAEMLAARKTVRHHPALPYAEVPNFMAELREREGISARALEFAILTAARTGEIIGARWPEINFVDKTWTVPADRMKAAKEHTVPLSDRALEILGNMPREVGNGFIFPGRKAAKSISDMAMLELMRDMRNGYTVHGFRSAFRDWAGDRTHFAREVIEACLAHGIKDKTERAYRRETAIDKRRALMTAWASYCLTPPTVESQVIPFKSSAS